jgi:RNA polymerase sigma-70 factor (ECF subfamily)
MTDIRRSTWLRTGAVSAAATNPYASADDVGLVVAIARYHEDAFAEAYRRHAGSVFALASRMLWERAVAEEVVQEIFLRLWEHPERYDRSRGEVMCLVLFFDIV